MNVRRKTSAGRGTTGRGRETASRLRRVESRDRLEDPLARGAPQGGGASVPGRSDRLRQRRVRPAARRPRPVSRGCPARGGLARGRRQLRPLRRRGEGAGPPDPAGEQSGRRSSPLSACVDAVVLFDEDSPGRDPIGELAARRCTPRGPTTRPSRVPERDVVAAYGGRTGDRRETRRTTPRPDLIERIRKTGDGRR